MSESAPSDSSSLSERESISSSSSSSSYARNGAYRNDGVKGEEKKRKTNILTLSFENFEELRKFLQDHKDMIFSLKYLSKNQVILDIMSELGAFTKTSLKEFCDEFDQSTSAATIRKILEILEMMGLVAYAVIPTNLLPAEIYYFPGVIWSEKQFSRLKKKYQERWDKMNPKLKGNKKPEKKQKKNPEQIKSEMKEKWQAQKQAAKELKEEEQKEEEAEQNRIHVQNWQRVPYRMRKKHVASCKICQEKSK